MKTPDFTSLNKHNALAFFNAYMAEKESGLATLRQLSESSGGPNAETLDFSKESLIPLWVWFCKNASVQKSHPPLSNLPIWYNYAIINNGFFTPLALSEGIANIVNGFAYYLGEMIIHHIPDTQWTIGGHKGSLGFCCPVVQGTFFGEYPLHNAISLNIYAASHQDVLEEKALYNMLEQDIETSKKYKAAYIANGNKHVDPRMNKLVKFK